MGREEWLDLWSGPRKEIGCKVEEKMLQSRVLWVDTGEWAESVKVFVLCINAQWRIFTTRKALNDQIDKMT